MSAPSITDRTASIRAGLLTREELKAELPGNPTDRTIRRYENLGLPVIRRGRMRLYDIEAVCAWLRGERRNGRRSEAA